MDRLFRAFKFKASLVVYEERLSFNTFSQLNKNYSSIPYWDLKKKVCLISLGEENILGHGFFS